MILSKEERQSVIESYMKLPVNYCFSGSRYTNGQLVEESLAKMQTDLMGKYRRVDTKLSTYNDYSNRNDNIVLSAEHGYTCINSNTERHTLITALNKLMDMKPGWATSEDYDKFVLYVERVLNRRVDVSAISNKVEVQSARVRADKPSSNDRRTTSTESAQFIKLSVEYLKTQVISESRWNNLGGSNDAEKVFNWLKERKEKSKTKKKK